MRELGAEPGLVNVELGAWVWTRHGRRPVGDDMVPTLARFFLVQTTAFVPTTEGIGSSELDVDWRWWAVDELDGEPSASLIPGRLTHLVRDLIEGRIPTSPIDVSDPS